MSRRNKDRIYIPDLEKELVEKLRWKLQDELLRGSKEKIELGPQSPASGNSIGSLTLVYKSPSKKQWAIHIRHKHKKSFEIEMNSNGISLRSFVEFGEIRNQFHSLIDFLKKI